MAKKKIIADKAKTSLEVFEKKEGSKSITLQLDQGKAGDLMLALDKAGVEWTFGV